MLVFMLTFGEEDHVVFVAEHAVDVGQVDCGVGTHVAVEGGLDYVIGCVGRGRWVERCVFFHFVFV
jgi:hypothetical protein